MSVETTFTTILSGSTAETSFNGSCRTVAYRSTRHFSIYLADKVDLQPQKDDVA